MGIMKIQDRTGDTVAEWDISDPKMVAAAKKTFDDLMAKNHIAYKAKPEGGEVIKSFDPDAAEIIVAVPLVGG